jgi:hypothetical protein
MQFCVPLLAFRLDIQGFIWIDCLDLFCVGLYEACLSVNVSVCSIALDEVASWTYILAHEH